MTSHWQAAMSDASTAPEMKFLTRYMTLRGQHADPEKTFLTWYITLRGGIRGIE
jgi:hypothetical protein